MTAHYAFRETTPLADLLGAAKELLVSVEADCAMTPPGHEAACGCPTHVRAREACDALTLVIERIERA